MEEQPQDRAAPEQAELPICPGCMAENDPAADFCVKCGQPLSAIATTDPFRQTLSEGYWYRTAASGRVRPIVFWGTWALFLPTMIAIVPMVWSSLFGPDREVSHRVLLLALSGGIALPISVLLYRMTGNYLATRRAERDAPPEVESEPSDE